MTPLLCPADHIGTCAHDVHIGTHLLEAGSEGIACEEISRAPRAFWEASRRPCSPRSVAAIARMVANTLRSSFLLSSLGVEGETAIVDSSCAVQDTDQSLERLPECPSRYRNRKLLRLKLKYTFAGIL